MAKWGQNEDKHKKHQTKAMTQIRTHQCGRKRNLIHYEMVPIAGDQYVRKLGPPY